MTILIPLGIQFLSVRPHQSLNVVFVLMLKVKPTFFYRKLDTAQPLKMLMASGDDSNKRRGVFPPRILLYVYFQSGMVDGILI